jgi:hypothetical protein
MRREPELLRAKFLHGVMCASPITAYSSELAVLPDCEGLIRLHGTAPDRILGDSGQRSPAGCERADGSQRSPAARDGLKSFAGKGKCPLDTKPMPSGCVVGGAESIAPQARMFGVLARLFYPAKGLWFLIICHRAYDH